MMLTAPAATSNAARKDWSKTLPVPGSKYAKAGVLASKPSTRVDCKIGAGRRVMVRFNLVEGIGIEGIWIEGIGCL